MIEVWANAFRKCMEKPSKRAENIQITFPSDGRLDRTGLHPWLAQRIRDIMGKRHLHVDGGGEWPTGSGLMAEGNEETIMNLVKRLDQ